MKFRKTSIALAIAFPLLLSSNAFAQSTSTDDRLQQAEQRIRYLEQRVQDQSSVVAEQKTTKESDTDDNWYDNVEITGLVEVEAFYTDPEEGDSESDIVAATVELGLAANLNKQTSVEVIFLFEEDETDLEIDVAQLTHAFANSPWSLTAGQIYVPFGAYETALLSDPLTLEIGETRETTLLLGFEQNAVSGSFYIFNGDNSEGEDNEIDNWGANIGFGNDVFSVGIGYINDIGDSDVLQDSLESNEVDDYTPGVSANGSVILGPITLIAEYTAATDEFGAEVLGGAEPSAANLELDYEFPIAGKSTTFAISYQETDEALALELPETRLLLGLGFEINDHFNVGIELAFDEDYDVEEGGTGDSTTTALLQLAAEF